MKIKSSNNQRSGERYFPFIHNQKKRAPGDPRRSKLTLSMFVDSSVTAGPSIIPQKGPGGKGGMSVPSNVLAEEGVGGSDLERGDAARVSSLPPARVTIPSDSPVVQIACGLHHTGETMKKLRVTFQRISIGLDSFLLSLFFSFSFAPRQFSSCKTGKFTPSAVIFTASSESGI